MSKNSIPIILKASLKGHIGSARCVGFSPDGKTLVSVGDDGTIRLWNVELVKEQRVLNGKAKMNAVAFSPGGEFLATVDTSGRTRLWSLKAGKSLWSRRATYSGLDCSTDVAFSPNGKTVVSSSCGIRLLNVEDGKDIVQFPDTSRTVPSIAFSPDGMTLVSCTVEEGDISLWETTTGQEMRSLRGHTYEYGGKEYRQEVWCVAFSPDGKTIASGSSDQKIKLWDANTGKNVGTLDGHAYYVFDVDFSARGRLLASTSADLTVRLWDTSTKKCWPFWR